MNFSWIYTLVSFYFCLASTNASTLFFERGDGTRGQTGGPDNTAGQCFGIEGTNINKLSIQGQPGFVSFFSDVGCKGSLVFRKFVGSQVLVFRPAINAKSVRFG
jgi:hypothetical protein